MSYKIYFYFKEDRGNLKYDVKVNNKYYKKILR